MRLWSILLAGCSVNSGPWSVPPDQAGIPNPIDDRGSPAVLLEVSPARPTAIRTHADEHGLWVMAWSGAGYDLDLMPVPDEGLSMWLQPAEGAEPIAYPPPPLPFDSIEAFRQGRDAITFLPTVAGVALVVGDTLFLGTPTGWRERPWSSAGAPPPVAVDGDRVVTVALGGEVWVEGSDGGVDLLGAPPLGADEEALPPWSLGAVEDGVARVVWFRLGQVCSGRWSLDDGSLSAEQCADFDVPVALRSAVGGTVDRGHFIVSASSILRAFDVWVEATDDGVTVLGELPPLDADLTLHDAPGDDRLPLLEDGDGSPLAWLTADGAHVQLPTSVTATLPLGTECPPPAEADPFGSWCVARQVPVISEQRSGSGRWTVAFENNHDGVSRVFGAQTLPTPTPLTIAPFTGGQVLAQGYTPAPVQVFGSPLPDDCLVARDPDGVAVERGAAGEWLVDELTSYTVELLPCALADGGPPLLGFTSTTYPSRFEPFELGGVVLGRGWPIDALDDPPQVVVDASLPGMIVREVAGWTSITRDPVDGIAREVVDEPSAAAPRLLPGGRVLLEDGTLYDGTPAPEAVPLALLPAEARVQGTWLVQDGSDVLRVHDLSLSPPVALIDETGPRTWSFVTASDDGARIVERSADGQRVRIREPLTASVAELGPYQDGVVAIDLSEDAELLVVSSEQSVYRRVVQLDLAGGFPGVQTEICPFCGPHALLADGRVLAGDDLYTVTAGAVTSEPVLGAPNQQLRRGLLGGVDAYGFAWWSGGTGVDLRLPFSPASPSLAVAAWPGELDADAPGWTWDQPWWVRLDGPGQAADHHLLHTGVRPLAGGRGARRDPTNGRVSIGDFTPGDLLLTDPVVVFDAPAAVLDGVGGDHPRYSQRPCELYRWESSVDYTDQPSIWACVY